MSSLNIRLIVQTQICLNLIAALGVLSVIAVEGFSMMQQQQAYGGCERRFAPGIAFNASKGHCFHP
ncbi:MAG: hypothetical protein M3264_05565 [Thermoproteota archaeon]|nr:hypothetical protein [Thermoproteota archaeon]